MLFVSAKCSVPLETAVKLPAKLGMLIEAPVISTYVVDVVLCAAISTDLMLFSAAKVANKVAAVIAFVVSVPAIASALVAKTIRPRTKVVASGIAAIAAAISGVMVLVL